VKYRYWIESGTLCVADEARLVWRESRPAIAVVEIAGSDDAAVLLDPETGPRNALGDFKGGPHLVRVTPQGQITWRIEAGSNDFWVSVKAEGDRLIANTWSGFRRELDCANGRVLSEQFTK